MDMVPESSIAFARIFGIISLVGGLGAAFFCRSYMSAAIHEVAERPALMWIWGFINLIFGATIIAFHGAWTSDWRVIITIAGWAGVLKGALLMLFPDYARALYRRSNKPGVLMVGGIVAILLGLFLLYAGYAGSGP
jgi:hypothetical protein